MDYQAEGCDVANSIEDALKLAANADEIMVIGGSSLFEQMKQQYGARDEKLAKQFENPDVHRDIANRLITEKTVDKLVKIYEK